MSEEQTKESKSLVLNKWGIIGSAAVILIVLIVGISIYSSPDNHFSRLLDLGYQYLEEGNYEQAALTFDEAIDIDNKCMEAYAGAIKAYQGLDDEERLVSIYARSIYMISKLEEAELSGNVETIAEIYLAADDVYSNNLEKTVEVLETGLKRTEDGRIKNVLIEDYLKLAWDYAGQDDYEKALEIYDRLLELDGESDEILSAIDGLAN